MARLVEEFRISECPACVEHFLAPEQRFLPEAGFSVAVSRGMSGLEILRLYFQVFHSGGHTFEGSGIREGAKRVAGGE